ncbi:MAG: Hsp33 family molecular chaperone [Hyphomicrobiales bacterium]|nr:Hsp33 family molecular chaperone [Hyphomicrobiales bacterium]
MAAHGMADPPDDLVLPFHLSASRMSGRILRLGRVVDTILTRHDYPEPVCHALGDALALTGMIATALRFDSKDGDGRFILQTRTDGPIGLIVVHYDAPGRLRGYASHTLGDDAPTGRGDQAALLGSGNLAMTIDPGGDLDRYQGIVPLDREELVSAAQSYFRQSEQLPTFIRLALARIFVNGAWSWRAGGLMLQHIPREGGTAPPGETPEEHDERLEGDFDENWQRVRFLAETVEDHELLDPTLAPERLLFRLFHEEGVRVTDALPLSAECRCSRERILSFLTRFGAEELSDMRQADGSISVTCEFCSTKYSFEPGSIT